VIPAVNQAETHPFSQKTEIKQALKAHDIRLEAWVTFAQGENKLFTNYLLKALASNYN
jgi:2,5-diketo-D-gluconate reductase A